MTTFENIERIKPLFKDNIKFYYKLMYQILDYNELLLVIPNDYIDYYELSRYISKECFYENINKPWNLTEIVKNKNFTLNDILLDNRLKHYTYLIYNPSITLQQLIDNNLLTDYHKRFIAFNPNVTINEFEKYFNQSLAITYEEFNEELIDYILYNDLYYNLFIVISSKGFTYRLYLKYKHLFIDSGQLDSIVYKNIELSDINEFSKQYPINYDYLSENPNLTIDFIVENMDKPWNLTKLSCGRFIKHKEEQPYLKLKFVE